MPTTWLNAADGVKHDRFLVLTGGHPSSTSGASNGALMYDAVQDLWTWMPLLDHMLYGAEGDGDGTFFWTVSGRMYVDATWSNSPYTTLLDQCEECVPVSGADFTVDPLTPRPNMPATFTGSVAGGSPGDHLRLELWRRHLRQRPSGRSHLHCGQHLHRGHDRNEL